MTEIVLHIGAPKTGSTALQRFLSEHREPLAARGLDYPDVSLRGFGHHDLAFLVFGGYPHWASRQEASLQDLISMLAAAIAAGPERLVLSSENLYLFPNPARLAEVIRSAGARSDPPVRVVVYLRRQDDAHLSWYNQMVKAQGYSGAFAEAVDAYFELWDYRRQLELWASVFGQSNLVVRRYQRGALASDDICRDFLSILDVDSTGLALPDAPTNTRLNRDILEFQRLINRLPAPAERLRRHHRALIELTRITEGEGIFDDTPLIDDTGRAQLLARYADSNSVVARSYFGAAELFSAPEPAPSATASAPHAEHVLSAKAIAVILGWLLMQA